MDLTLYRTDFLATGIFGQLNSQDGSLSLFTLEHAYSSDGQSYAPKIPAGTYKCVRGIHQLEHSPNPFETFEITGVAGHSGLLFHVGNWESCSTGCVLLGTSRPNSKEILNSGEAFEQFMNAESGVDEFWLTVTN